MASPTDNRISLAFNYAEHVDIGGMVKELLIEYFPNADILKTGKVSLKNGLEIDVSEFYALMGDFFGQPETPIASGKSAQEQQSIFRKALSLMNDSKPEQLKKIIEIGAIQKEALKNAKEKCACQPKSQCDCAEKALTSVATITNQLWNQATGGAYYLYPIFQGEYLKLSKNNLDHFSDSAKQSYRAGHEVALQLINDIQIERSKDKPDESKIKALTHQALLAESSAGHYLTDAFSAGHVRIPRKELYELKTVFGLPVPKAITGLFTLVMHNEDGHNGVWVTDPLTQDVWKTYGDDALLTGKSSANRIKVTAAARMGMLETIGKLKEALGEKPDPNEFPKWGTTYKLLPENYNKGQVTTPLFKTDEQGRLLRRKDVNNPHDKEYIANWHVITTLLLLLPKIIEYIMPSLAFWKSAHPKPSKDFTQMKTRDKPELRIYNQQVEIIKRQIAEQPQDAPKNSHAIIVQSLGPSVAQPQRIEPISTTEKMQIPHGITQDVDLQTATSLKMSF